MNIRSYNKAIHSVCQEVTSCRDIVPIAVLVVGDDPKILSLLRRGRVSAGYVVDAAAAGEAALVAARDRHPDMVALGVMLPGVDTVEVCRRLRMGDASLPILMLTQRSRPRPGRRSDAGADDYLVKPFDFDELLARIRALPAAPGRCRRSSSTPPT